MAEIDDLRREVQSLREQNAKLVDALIAAVTARPATVQPYPVPYPTPQPLPQPAPPWQSPFVVSSPNTCSANDVSKQITWAAKVGFR